MFEIQILDNFLNTGVTVVKLVQYKITVTLDKWIKLWWFIGHTTVTMCSVQYCIVFLCIC